MAIYVGNTEVHLTNIDKVYVGNNLVYTAEPDYMCLTLTRGLSTSTTGSIYLYAYNVAPVLYYRLNRGEWTQYTFGSRIAMNVDDKCYWKGDNNTLSTGSSNYISFNLNGYYDASGNIMSLVDSTCTSTTIPCDYCFTKLFEGCQYLQSAPKLPATTLTSHCYDKLFADTRIRTAPTLPATEMKSYCYSCMFAGTYISNCPNLPASTLAEGCYESMFYDCVNIRTTPKLIATELKTDCYTDMFYMCNLTIYDQTHSLAPYEWKIPESGTFTNDTTLTFTNMFAYCDGARTSDDLVAVPGESITLYTNTQPV